MAAAALNAADVESAKASGTGSAVVHSSAGKERLELLAGMTGFAVPGVLLALMGGSGAGVCVRKQKP